MVHESSFIYDKVKEDCILSDKGGILLNPQELQMAFNKAKQENEKLTRQKTGWMVAAIVLGILFVIALGIIFAR